VDGHTRPSTNLWKGLQCRIISKKSNAARVIGHIKKVLSCRNSERLTDVWTILGMKFMLFSLSASFVWNIFCSDKHRALFFYPTTITFTSRLYSSCVWPVWRMGYVNKKNEPAGSCNRYFSHKITTIMFSKLRLRAAWCSHIAGNFVWEWSVQS
jgi:hypothetical protein